MTITRLVLSLAIALVLQAAVFAWYHDDLLYLRQPAEQIVRGDTATFAVHAERALVRPKLTRRHLDTIAEGARHHGYPRLEVTALERRVALDPDDDGLRMRLADAYHRAGRLDEAERLYVDLLRTLRKPQP